MKHGEKWKREREKFESYQLFTTPDTNACRCGCEGEEEEVR